MTIPNIHNVYLFHIGSYDNTDDVSVLGRVNILNSYMGVAYLCITKIIVDILFYISLHINQFISIQLLFGNGFNPEVKLFATIMSP